MSIEFNAVSLPSLSQMLCGLSEPIPVEHLSDHDHFPSWERVMEQNDFQGRRLLFRSAEGGIRWVHVDCDGLAHRSTSISNEEARRIWVEHLLSFSEEEVARLTESLQPGAIFHDALEAAISGKRMLRGCYLPEPGHSDTESIRERVFFAHDGGLVRAQVSDGDILVSSQLIQGREAWEVIQPLVDPTPDQKT